MDDAHARDRASHAEPLPPARTRWAQETGRGPGSGSLLGPVRSGRAGAVAPEPVFPIEETRARPVSIQPDERDVRPEPPAWEEAAVAAMETAAEDELEAEPEIELSFDTTGDEVVFGSTEPEPTIVDEAARIEPEAAGMLEREEEARPTPVSAWDLTSSSTGATDRARRAREEWDSLEKALARSLDTTGNLQSGASPLASVPTELEELARRLEQFAAALRTDGTRAMEMAQSRGDPIDVVLAAIAAGYASGRRE